MNLSRMLFVSAIGALVVGALSYTAHGTIATVYVDKDVTEDEPAGQGDDWGEDHAYKYLQDGLARAEYLLDNELADNVQVWVAEGTYYPDEDHNNPSGTGSRNASFYLLEHVQIYGGFNGTEDDVADRDVYLYETVLSGDINTPNDASDNSYHVLRAEEVDNTAMLNGFIIRDGYASGVCEMCGAGMWINEAYPVVILCTFTGNEACSAGGGLHMLDSSPGPCFVDCRFLDNVANNGAGVESVNTRSYFINCLFAGNSVDEDGGGMRISSNSDIGLVNCTFSRNDADDNGGGILLNVVADGTLSADNCIFWGNTDGGPADESEQISDTTGGAPFVNVDIEYCCIEDENPHDEFIPFGGAYKHNIDDDPDFKDANNAIYRLCITSPCIEAGDQSKTASDSYDIDHDSDTSEKTPDLDLLDRVMPDANPHEVDMGAYEFRCYADANEDCSVDVHDLTTILNNWGDCDDPCPPYCTGDVNHDCTVDADDLQMVLDQWGCGEDDPGDPPAGIDDCIDLYGDDYEELKSCIDTILLTQGGG